MNQKKYNENIRLLLLSNILMFLASGCLSPNSKSCADGTICDSEKICFQSDSNSSFECVESTLVEACVGLAQATTCSLQNGAVGVCSNGLCLVSNCGDSIVEGKEVCDDGNTLSGDGCRSDCLASEWQTDIVMEKKFNKSDFYIDSPKGIALDSNGQLYIATALGGFIGQIIELDREGVIRTAAGVGLLGNDGDLGQATNARIGIPYGIAIDNLDNLYFSDFSNHLIRKVSPTGIITTVVSDRFVPSEGPDPVEPRFGGDGGLAVEAFLHSPKGIAVDGLGNLYIADSANHRIRRVNTAGVIDTVAGTGVAGYTGDGGLAVNAQLNSPAGISVDSFGNLLVADELNHRVRVIGRDGVISTMAGIGTPGFSGDGSSGVMAQLDCPSHAISNELGEIYIADSKNNRIRKVGETGMISTVAGTDMPILDAEDEPVDALDAALKSPHFLALNSFGELLISEINSSVIKLLNKDGALIDVAGSSVKNKLQEGRPATNTITGSGRRIAINSQGEVLLSLFSESQIKKIDTDGNISTIAGSSSVGYSGDGGAALLARLDRPRDLLEDSSGNLIFVDSGNKCVREIRTDGTIQTVIGSEASGRWLDGRPAVVTTLVDPSLIHLAEDGSFYFVDSNKIYRVDNQGSMVHFAGIGTIGFSGDGGQAINALIRPTDLASDKDGNLVISERFNHRIRSIDSNGIISTIGGNGTPGYSGDGSAALTAELNEPSGLVFDEEGRILFADRKNNVIRAIELDGRISTKVGSGVADVDGNGGHFSSAELIEPRHLAIHTNGDLFFTSGVFSHIRKIKSSTGVVTFAAGAIDPKGTGRIEGGYLAEPLALAVSPALTIFAGGSAGKVQAILQSPEDIRAKNGKIEVVAGRHFQSNETSNLAKFRAFDFGGVNGVAIDESRSAFYFSEHIELDDSESSRLMKVTRIDDVETDKWQIEAIAGSVPGFVDGDGMSARFDEPSGIYLNKDGSELWVADTQNHIVRSINTDTKEVLIVAGIAAEEPGNILPTLESGMKILATEAKLNLPKAVTQCANGDWFIADTGNDRVVRIDSDLNMTKVLGVEGVVGASGEGSPSRTFPVFKPMGLACDEDNNLFVASTITVRLLSSVDNGTGMKFVDGSGDVQNIVSRDLGFQCIADVAVVSEDIAADGKAGVWMTDSCRGALVELIRPNQDIGP